MFSAGATFLLPKPLEHTGVIQVRKAPIGNWRFTNLNPVLLLYDSILQEGMWQVHCV
jgi:hypothetical protein